MISSQHHTFDIRLASIYGIECAIIIHHLQHWIRINYKNRRNQINGKTWMFQSRKEMASFYPYWGPDAVYDYLEKLVAKGVIIKGCFNKKKFDKTNWYAFNDEKLFGVDPESIDKMYDFSNNPYVVPNGTIECAESHNRLGRSAQPIPDTKKDTKEDKRERKSASPPALDDFFVTGRIKIKLTDYKKLFEEFPDKKIDEEIEKANQWLIDYNEYRKNYLAFTKQWLRRIKPEHTPQEKNLNKSGGGLDWARKVKAVVESREADVELIVTNGYCELRKGKITQEALGFTDPNFRQKLISQLTNIKANMEGIT